jgi:hypothetical protein
LGRVLQYQVGPTYFLVVDIDDNQYQPEMKVGVISRSSKKP